MPSATQAQLKFLGILGAVFQTSIATNRVELFAPSFFFPSPPPPSFPLPSFSFSFSFKKIKETFCFWQCVV